MAFVTLECIYLLYYMAGRAKRTFCTIGDLLESRDQDLIANVTTTQNQARGHLPPSCTSSGSLEFSKPPSSAKT